jgi:hypothetical protein
MTHASIQALLYGKKVMRYGHNLEVCACQEWKTRSSTRVVLTEKNVPFLY